MKKALFILMIIILSTSLIGCGLKEPESSVKGFLNAYRDRDFDKAGKYVIGGEKKLFDKEVSTETNKKMLQALAKDFKYEKPVLKSANGDSAKVKVKVTSVDLVYTVSKIANNISFTELMYMSSLSNKESSDLFYKKMIKSLNSKDVEMQTRTVTLNLKKDKNGEYRIVPDDNLGNILSNSEDLNKKKK